MDHRSKYKKTKPIQLVNDIGRNPCNFALGKDFLDIIPTA